MSVWLSLVPQLESAGSYPGAGGGHGVLTGPTWGLVRNTTNFPGVQQISLSDKVLSPLSSTNHNCLSSPDDARLPGVSRDDHLQPGAGPDLPGQPEQHDPGQPGGWERPLHRQHGDTR